MICPECGEDNINSAKFCKKCGTSLTPASTIKNDFNSDNQARPIKSAMYENSNNSSSSYKSATSGGDNKNLIIICLTIIICAVLIAGGFIFLSNNGSSDSGASDSISLSDDSINQTEDNSSISETTVESSSSSMKILGGTFSTGSSLSDKTYCSVYVGEQYAGENVKISVLYSRDGSNLNQGNIVPKTVSSDGYISVPSAYAFDKYPDNAFVTIYGSDGNVLDTLDVDMAEKSGTQSF